MSVAPRHQYRRDIGRRSCDYLTGLQTAHTGEVFPQQSDIWMQSVCGLRRVQAVLRVGHYLELAIAT